MTHAHTLHIPVMGMAFTIDTPMRVAPFGIDAVIAIGNDILFERLRKMYCGKYNLPFEEITSKTPDFRAKRITSYLNLINKLAQKKFDELKSMANEKGEEIKEYFNMLPDSSQLKQEFRNLTAKCPDLKEIESWLKENLSMGSIDVNIMTKLDKANFSGKTQLPVEFNDAHAALRGYAESNLESSIVFSAGMNPRLYGYIEQFDDFFPNEDGEIIKKIILKVSDYRSALIQGKFLAKKGLWVSEYRIESGLNCGGHAFATQGHLMGPILEEFKKNKVELIETIHEILSPALEQKGRPVPQQPLSLKITAQGGVGTHQEHEFLMDYYQLDSIGWGTPFLLVPEVTNVDEETRKKLMEAKEEDLYLSSISPLGVPFNSLKGNTKQQQKNALVEKGRPGSSCPKKYLSFDTEFTEIPICTASRQYQHLKIKQLEEKNLSDVEYKRQFDKIVDKTCLCTGLSTTVLINHEMDTKVEGAGVSICPGPNMAYFSKELTLHEMADHIYGRTNVITRTDRPHMFVKELSLYIHYLDQQLEDADEELGRKDEKFFSRFIDNLEAGINYYRDLFENKTSSFDTSLSDITQGLNHFLSELRELKIKMEKKLPSVVNA